MNTDVGKALGQTIASIRTTNDMTQEALAAKVGISPRSIQRIEAGSEQPRYGTLFKITHALNANPADLITPMWESWLSKQSN